MDSIKFKIPILYLKEKIPIQENLKNDLELIQGDNPLYQTFFKTKDPSNIENKLIEQHASWFTNNKHFLKQTQHIIKGKLPNLPDCNEICEFKNKGINESILTDKFNYIEWKSFKFLNQIAFFMQVYSIYNISSPVISLFIPILFLLIPFFIIKMQGNKITWEHYYTYLKLIFKNHSLGQIFNIKSASWDKRGMYLISIGFYFLQFYCNVSSCIKFIKNMKEIHNTIFSVKKYLIETIKSIEFTSENWKSHSTYAPFIQENKNVSTNAKVMLQEISRISKFGFSFSKCLDIGETMSVFYKINNEPKWIQTLDYCLDYNIYICNISKIKSQISTKINPAVFSNSTKFKNMYYPHLPKDKAISNSLKIDKNLIITGPNAAGKTTLLKTIMINIILSQQFGFGYYDKANIKLYELLSSYINIPDTSNRDSLFQAEARRCKEILDDSILNKNKNHFCIFDEIYSGTNPYEAISCASAYLKFLSKNNHMTFILTTHYLDLCKILNREKSVKNLQMQVKNKNNNFIYTYKISHGISNIKGGIKVLYDLDYPQNIIDDAKINIFKENNTFI